VRPKSVTLLYHHFKPEKEVAVEDQKKSWTLTVGWVILFVLGLLLAFQGLESLLVAYRGADESLAGVSLQDLAKLNPALPDAIRGRRATAASLAFSFGLLLMWMAVTAYRRREKWAWWALLCSVGLGSLTSLMRVPLLGQSSGAVQPGVFLALLLLALAVSYRDFR
jgi:hypothetical protein